MGTFFLSKDAPLYQHKDKLGIVETEDGDWDTSIGLSRVQAKNLYKKIVIMRSQNMLRLENKTYTQKYGHLMRTFNFILDSHGMIKREKINDLDIDNLYPLYVGEDVPDKIEGKTKLRDCDADVIQFVKTNLDHNNLYFFSKKVS